MKKNELKEYLDEKEVVKLSPYLNNCIKLTNNDSRTVYERDMLESKYHNSKNYSYGAYWKWTSKIIKCHELERSE